MSAIEEDELKKGKLKLAEAQWREYLDQVSDDEKKETIVQSGPMSGKSVTQLSAKESQVSKSVPSTSASTETSLTQDKSMHLAEKIQDKITKKEFPT